MGATKTLIILANSVRPGGRCVAGICTKTGKWIRPVSRDPDRAVPEVPSIRRIALLDVVRVPLAGDRPDPPDRFQSENWFVDRWDWEVIGRCSPKDAIALCERPGLLFFTNNDRVAPSYLEHLPPAQWKSLVLIQREVGFVRDAWKRKQWRARFRDGRGNVLCLKVTDPAITEKLNNNETVSGTCLLTISLTAPWAPSDGCLPERCYKLVAGVIEL